MLSLALPSNYIYQYLKHFETYLLYPRRDSNSQYLDPKSSVSASSTTRAIYRLCGHLSIGSSLMIPFVGVTHLVEGRTLNILNVFVFS